MQPIILESPAYKICIDHHEDNNLDAELKITSESVSATAELIYDLLINLKATIDREISTLRRNTDRHKFIFRAEYDIAGA